MDMCMKREKWSPKKLALAGVGGLFLVSIMYLLLALGSSTLQNELQEFTNSPVKTVLVKLLHIALYALTQG